MTGIDRRLAALERAAPPRDPRKMTLGELRQAIWRGLREDGPVDPDLDLRVLAERLQERIDSQRLVDADATSQDRHDGRH